MQKSKVDIMTHLVLGVFSMCQFKLRGVGGQSIPYIFKSLLESYHFIKVEARI